LGRVTEKEPEMCASLAELGIKGDEEVGGGQVDADVDGKVSDKQGEDDDNAGNSVVAGGDSITKDVDEEVKKVVEGAQ